MNCFQVIISIGVGTMLALVASIAVVTIVELCRVIR